MSKTQSGNLSKSDIDSIFDLSASIIESSNRVNKTNELTLVEEQIEQKRSTDIAQPIVFGQNGIMISGDKLSKTRYLDSVALNEELYKNILLTESEAKKLQRSINIVVGGGVTSAAPMICRGSKCKFNETCLTGDTIVLMYDGSYRRIDSIKDRDRIWSFDKLSKEMSEDHVVHGAKLMGTKEVFLIRTAHGHEVKATSTHLFLSKKGRDKFDYISIDDGLSVGHSLIFTDGFYNEALEEELVKTQEYGDCFITKIVSISSIGEEEVYDIEVLKNKNFFANGIVVHNCELYKMNKAPVGAPCIYEQLFLKDKTEAYFEEFDVTSDKVSEMHMVAELAELDLYERRATQMLSITDQDLSQEIIAGFTEGGGPIIKDDVSRYFSIKERIKKQRHKILESLLATKKERAKVVNQINSNNNTNNESVKDKLDMILSQVTSGKYVDPSVKDIIDVN